MEDVYNYASYTACASELEFGEFKSQAPVGEKAPNFTLRTLKGREVTLADFHGSYLVLDFGSITWPPFIGEVPRLEKLYQEYKPKGFEFRIVYVREAHPGENFPHHTSPEQKLRHASALKELEQVGIPILIDDLEGTVHKAYGLRPNMLYLIDREGTVVYKSDWSNAHELKEMCDSLLRLEAMRAQNVPIIRQGYSERLHWIDMDPALRERVYKRSGDKAIEDFVRAKGYQPHATDAERAKAKEVAGCGLE